MLQEKDEIVDYDKEVEFIDKAIVTHQKEIEELICKRYELIAKKTDLDMHEIIECLYESDLEPKEVMELIVAAIKDKRKKA